MCGLVAKMMITMTTVMMITMMMTIMMIFQVHWLAVNGRTELLQDMLSRIKDVNIEVNENQCVYN